MTKDNIKNAAKLHEAILYAARAHKGQMEPSTEIDYICHAMEVLEILTSMDADIDLKIAGVLHDVVNKTLLTLDDIAEKYGKNVATLLEFTVEDESASWKQRTESIAAKLNFADKRAQMLVMADKTAHQRSLGSGHKKLGELVWVRYGASKKDLCCYYSAVQDSLKEMQNYEETSPVYWEMVSTFKDMFVNFWANEEMDTVYQVAEAGSYRITKAEPTWFDFEEELPAGLIKVTRKQSEHMEAEWLTNYIIHIESRDLRDGAYEIYEGGGNSNTRKLSVYVSGRKIQFNCYDDSIYVDENGQEQEHRFYYELARKESAIFAKMLRSQYGAGQDFGEILKDAFGYYDGPIKFKAFCEAFNLGYVFCTDKH